jgi:hypothetical protein
LGKKSPFCPASPPILWFFPEPYCLLPYASFEDDWTKGRWNAKIIGKSRPQWINN